jgi:hypothetical protein
MGASPPYKIYQKYHSVLLLRQEQAPALHQQFFDLVLRDDVGIVPYNVSMQTKLFVL